MNPKEAPPNRAFDCVVCEIRYEVVEHYHVVNFNFATIICKSCQEHLRSLLKREKQILEKL
jgi:transcription elongation factor Elf1